MACLQLPNFKTKKFQLMNFQSFSPLRSILSVLLILFSIVSIAQDDTYTIEGQVKDKSSLKKLEAAQVRVLQNGAEYDVYDCGGSGRFKFDLPLGYIYDIVCSRNEYVSKIIGIDTKNIAKKPRRWFYFSN